MRMAELVQLVECFLDLGIDPGIPAITGFRGTNRDDLGKGRVCRHPKSVGSDGFAERARHPEIVERDNRAGLWLDPEGFRIVPGVRHRKDSRRIGFYQKVEINGHELGIVRSVAFAQTEIDKDGGPSTGH